MHNLPEVLAGLPNLSFYDGWESRSRASGGYDKLLGIFVHHTASQTSTANDTRYQWVNARERPIGAIYLGRAGEIIVGAAGATNCQGVGGPRNTSKGTIPEGPRQQQRPRHRGRQQWDGEVWPDVQQDAYVALCQRLCNAYGFDPAHDIFRTGSGPQGRSIPQATVAAPTGGAKWNMDAFRNNVAGVDRHAAAPPSRRPTQPPPTQPADWWTP